MSNGESSVTDEQQSLSDSNQESTRNDQIDHRTSSKSDEENFDRIRDGKVPKPDDERKLFVGQLPSDITKEDLEKYFSTFGTIEDVTIKYDGPGGRARGFAFILFDEKESIEKVLNVSKHAINQCQIDPKQAHRRPPVNNPVKKIFLGQLPTEFVQEDLSTYFSQFGIVDTVELPVDRNKSIRRPFGFVSFSSEKTAEEVLRQQRHSINGVSIEVRPAKPRPHEQQQQQQQQHFHTQRYHHHHHQQQQQKPITDYQCYNSAPRTSSNEEYVIPQHSATFVPNLSTLNGQPMIGLANNLSSYYPSTITNPSFGAQIIDHYGQMANQSLSYWANGQNDSRNPNGNPQWSTGTNGTLTSINSNSHFYNNLPNGTAASTIYPGPIQTAVFNSNGLSHSIGYSSNSYSTPVQSSYQVAGASQPLSNIYPVAYSSPAIVTAGTTDQTTSSSSTSTWNSYNNTRPVLSGINNNYEHPNIYYTQSFYPNMYPPQFYSTAQQQTTLISQSQTGLPNDQTGSLNHLSASSNGAHEKNFQNHSR